MSKVVAKKVLLNQTSLISGLTIFTSSEGGDFVVNIYAQYKSVSASSGSLGLLVQWTDEFGSVAPPGNTIGFWSSVSQGSSSFGFPQLIRLAPNQSVELMTIGNAPPAGSFYNLYATVEEISAPGL